MNVTEERANAEQYAKHLRGECCGGRRAAMSDTGEPGAVEQLIRKHGPDIVKEGIWADDINVCPDSGCACDLLFLARAHDAEDARREAEVERLQTELALAIAETLDRDTVLRQAREALAEFCHAEAEDRCLSGAALMADNAIEAIDAVLAAQEVGK